MELYRRTRVPYRIFLSIFFDASNIYEVPSILKRITGKLEIMGIETQPTHYDGTNKITVTTQWTQSETELNVAELLNITGVEDVKAGVIGHGFTGPRISP